MKSLLVLVLCSTCIHLSACDPSVTAANPVNVFADSNGDGLNIRFYHGANTGADWQQALPDADVHMVEVDVQTSTSGRVILAHEPGQANGGDVDEYLLHLLQLVSLQPLYTSQLKGSKWDFKSKEAVQGLLDKLVQSQTTLYERGRVWDAPVWLHADFVPGPNAKTSQFEPIDAEAFIANVTRTFPNVTLSVGWVTGTPAGNGQVEEEYTWGMVMNMLRNVVPYTETYQPITFSIRAKWLDKSWEKFYWLYNQLPANFTYTIWSSEGDNPSDESYRALKTLREAIPKDALFYDVADPQFRGKFESVLADSSQATFELPQWPQLSWWRVVDSENKNLNLQDLDEEIRANRQFQNKLAFVGSEGAVITRNSVVLQTWAEHEAGETTLSGTVQFLPSEEAAEDEDIPSNAAEAHVFMRTTNISNVVASIADGVRLTIDRDGDVVLGETAVPSQAVAESLDQDIEAGCFHFEMTDKGAGTAVQAKVYTCAMGSQNQVVVSKAFSYEQNQQGFHLGLGKGGKEGDGEVMFRDVNIQHRGPDNGAQTHSAPTLTLAALSLLLAALHKLLQ